jgi:hypothetical protein
MLECEVDLYWILFGVCYLLFKFEYMFWLRVLDNQEASYPCLGRSPTLLVHQTTLAQLWPMRQVA